MNISTSVPVLLTWRLLLRQILGLNKAKERMQPYQSNQEEEDPDIKKIKKVNCWFYIIMRMKTKKEEQRETPTVLCLCRCKVSCVAGYAGGSGRSSSRITSVPLTLRA